MKQFKGIKLNLQTFSSDEEEILPDDFDDVFGEGTPADTDTDTELEGDDLEGNEAPPADGEQSTEGQTEQQQLEEFLKVKYNGEEKPLTQEEARQYAQMGMNYPKLQERLQSLENDPRFSFLDELARENEFDNVHDFIDAFRKTQEQARLDELIQQNIPEEYAKQMLETQKFMVEQKQQQQQQAQQQAEQQEYVDFFNVYKQANGKDFDPNTDKIPQEVIDIRTNENIPLQFAFMKFQNQQMQQQINVYKQNTTNMGKAPLKGGVTKHGSGSDNFAQDELIDGFDDYFR